MGQWTWFEGLCRDLIVGLRQMRRRLGFTTAVVITLACGIGATAGMFSIIDAVILRPLPYKNANRLTVIIQMSPRDANGEGSFDNYREFEEWSSHSESFQNMAAATWGSGATLMRWQGERKAVVAVPVTGDFFSMLGIHAALGRTFVPTDLENPCSVVLAHRFWQYELGGQPDLVGKSVVINDRDCRVLGVMPVSFSFYPKQTQLWMLITPESKYARSPWEWNFVVFGLLKRGVSSAKATAELMALQSRIRTEAPVDLKLQTVPMVRDLQSEFNVLASPNLPKSLSLLFASAGFVLLIACLNLANLFLGRASERQREFGIRAALGAGPLRLMRQLLIESLLFSTAGALVGLLGAAACVRYANRVAAAELPAGNQVNLNWHVFAFTAVLAILSALGFGLVPAWNASKIEVVAQLKNAGGTVAWGKSVRRTSQLVVIAELALSIILLVGAGLLIGTLFRLSNTSLGYNQRHLLTAFIHLPTAAYPSASNWIRFYNRLGQNLRSIPGISGVAFSPLLASSGERVRVYGMEPSQSPLSVSEQTVSSNYFRVMGILLLRGKGFTQEDRQRSTPVAIVNERLAGQFPKGEDVLGQRIRLGGAGGKQPWITVVGIAANVRTLSIFNEVSLEVRPCVYRPLQQDPQSAISVFVRTIPNPQAVEATLRRVISDADENLPPPTVETVEESLSQFSSQPRFRAALLGVFAALALFLSGVGIYAVLTQSVVERTHEIGIRMALGAMPGDIVRLVMMQGLKLIITGIVAGIGGALALSRSLSSFLYGVRPDDPIVLLAVSVTLAAVALVACYIPASRVTKIAPTEAIRQE